MGAKSGTLTIQSNDPDEPTRTVSLSGTAIAQDISLSTTSLTFGNQCINTTSAPQTVIVSNPSACTLTVTNITNSNSTDFDYTGPTSQTAVPGGNFTFTVAFDPETMGAKSGTITIASNDPDEPTVTVSLSGTSMDTTPPTISCPGAISASANASCQAAIPNVLINVTASDNCTPAASLTRTQSPAAGTLVGLGTHTIAVTVTDATGNSNQCQTTVTVVDTTAPTVSCSVSQSVLPTLWPPNHNLVNVGLSVSATEACDTNLTITVEVFGDEDDEEPTGDGTHSPDAKDIAPGTLRLRSERKGDADGRVYLIVVKATDDAGNVGVACCTVVVPKSQSQADEEARARGGVGRAYANLGQAEQAIGY